jgi:ABC-type transport system involved in multi-copper enzyme maturation permease subunit
MPARWGLGPVFAFEWLTASRRWQMYAVRALFVGLLFVAVLIVWFEKVDPAVRQARGPVDRNAHAAAGEALFYAFFGTLLSVTLLVAPGATAGAVCLDKARGTLLHLLVTDLSNTEIVCGKLAARLIPLLGLVTASLPVLSLCLLLGGIDPDAMLVAYAVTAGVAILGSALAFLLSVWGRKTHEVLLATYLFEVLLLLAYPIALALDAYWQRTVLASYANWTNPFILAYSPYLYRGATDPTDLTVFLSFCAGVTGVCVLLAVATIRRVTVRQASQPQQRSRRRWWDITLIRRPRFLVPRLDRNPILWREWHRQRPSRWVRLVWGVYAAGALAATGMLIYLNWGGRSSSGIAAITTALQASVGLLLASVAAVTSLAEERARGSLDVLLTTPLPTRTIVWGKWRAAFRLVPWLALLPAINVWVVAKDGVSPAIMTPPVPPGVAAPVIPAPVVVTSVEPASVAWKAVPLAFVLMLAYGAAVTSIGLACATWIRRLGRAVAASVVVYALVTVGWLALMGALERSAGHHRFIQLATASPFYGPGELAHESGELYQRTPAGDPECYGPLTFWTGFYGLVALLLYLAVLATFNRCLGRMRESAPLAALGSRRHGIEVRDSPLVPTADPPGLDR